MSAEHPINPEDIGRQIDGSFHIPNEDTAETPSEESEAVRAEYIRKAQERVEQLAPETRDGIEQISNKFFAIKQHSLEFDRAWPDLVSSATDIHTELKDAYTAYKNGAIDEEELQVVIKDTGRTLTIIRSMMDPDQRETPAE